MVSIACSFVLDRSTTGCQKLPDLVMALAGHPASHSLIPSKRSSIYGDHTSKIGTTLLLLDNEAYVIKGFPDNVGTGFLFNVEPLM